jgi:hypothetical protein
VAAAAAVVAVVVAAADIQSDHQGCIADSDSYADAGRREDEGGTEGKGTAWRGMGSRTMP